MRTYKPQGGRCHGGDPLGQPGYLTFAPHEHCHRADMPSMRRIAGLSCPEVLSRPPGRNYMTGLARRGDAVYSLHGVSTIGVEV